MCTNRFVREASLYLKSNSDGRKTILVMVGYYIPGHKAGGPIRSISNMVEALGDEFDFLILTSDRDLQSSHPYAGIISGTWRHVGKAKVMYLSKKESSILNLWRLLLGLEYDLLYLNSFFSRRFSMLPCFLRKFMMIPNTPIVLASRGEFSQGAIRLKYFRKKIYILFAKFFGIYNKIFWHASSVFEKKDIMREHGMTSDVLLALPVSDINNDIFNENIVKENIIIAMDMLNFSKPSYNHVREIKRVGSVIFCFLSRISPMKNLDMAIGLLDGLKGDIQYHIYGPIEDKGYWNQCKKRIETMAANIRIEYKGEVPHEQVEQVLSRYDFFLFPTRGENYGHVIVESLLAGCPVIISDQTPWRNLEASGVGWDIPLEDHGAFREVLQKCIVMDADEYAKYSTCAKEYAVNRCMDPEVLEQNRSLFRKALGDET